MLRKGLLPGAFYIAFSALSIIIVSGCSQEPAKTVYKATEPDRLTLLPPVGTMRVVKGGRLGETVVETHIDYPNGDSGHVYFHPDNGSLRQATEKYANGITKSDATFDRNGRLLNGEVRRPDDTRLLSRQELDNGSIQITYYSKEDKKLVFREKAAGGKSWIDTFYRPEDGSVLGRAETIVLEGGNTTDNWLDVFPRDGRRFHIQFLAAIPGSSDGAGRLISFYKKDQKLDFTQLWREGQYMSLGTNLHLEQVDEYGWNNTITRSLFFQEEQDANSNTGEEPTGEDGSIQFASTVSLLACKTKETTWGTGFMIDGPGGRRFVSGSGGQYRQIVKEVTRIYRLGEEDVKEVEIESWHGDQTWNQNQVFRRSYHGGTLASVETKTVDPEDKSPPAAGASAAPSSTAGQQSPETEKKAPAVEKKEHEAKENLHPDAVDITRLKVVNYDEFEAARQVFQAIAQDTSFLGQANAKDPCRWYFR